MIFTPLVRARRLMRTPAPMGAGGVLIPKRCLIMESFESDGGNKPLFQLRNVAKKYAQRDQPALDIEALNIPGGQVVALIGINGSGKTTLLNILGLLDQPDPGPGSSIRLNGEEMVGLDEAESRRQRASFGFVFQQGYLLENLPSHENIRIPPRLKSLEPLDEDIKKVLRWVDLVRGQDACRPSDLSAGERQRVAV